MKKNLLTLSTLALVKSVHNQTLKNVKLTNQNIVSMPTAEQNFIPTSRFCSPDIILVRLNFLCKIGNESQTLHYFDGQESTCLSVLMASPTYKDIEYDSFCPKTNKYLLC